MIFFCFDYVSAQERSKKERLGYKWPSPGQDRLTGETNREHKEVGEEWVQRYTERKERELGVMVREKRRSGVTRSRNKNIDVNNLKFGDF